MFLLLHVFSSEGARRLKHKGGESERSRTAPEACPPTQRQASIRRFCHRASGSLEPSTGHLGWATGACDLPSHLIGWRKLEYEEETCTDVERNSGSHGDKQMANPCVYEASTLPSEPLWCLASFIDHKLTSETSHIML